MIAGLPGTRGVSLPLLPSGPGGFCDSLLHRARLSKSNSISGGEGEIRTHGTCVHTLSKRAP